jgi:hypothetical protein
LLLLELLIHHVSLSFAGDSFSWLFRTRYW